MVAGGPKPGRTPMAVPTITPIKAKTTFQGLRATEKPWLKLAKKSMTFSYDYRPKRVRNPTGRSTPRSLSNKR